LDIKIKDVYDFFSHNIRTFNAEIVTTIECLKVGFIDLNSEEFHIIYEAAYLLDLYDAGFNLTLDFLTNNLQIGDTEEIDIEDITEEFLEHISGYLASCGLTVEKSFNSSSFVCNPHIFKNIYKIVLYEIVKNSSKDLKIKIDGDIEFTSSILKEPYPKIFNTFSEILFSFKIAIQIEENTVKMVRL